MSKLWYNKRYIACWKGASEVGCIRVRFGRNLACSAGRQINIIRILNMPQRRMVRGMVCSCKGPAGQLDRR